MKNILTTLSLVLFMSTFSFSDAEAQMKEEVLTRGPESGTLIIIGGAARDPIFREKFINLAGGENARIIIVPTAQGADRVEERDPEYARLKAPFEEIGVRSVHVLNTEDPEVANQESFIEPIKEATGVWFTGGRQWRIADGFLDTKAHNEFNKLLERGGVIAGSSAGATIQGSYLARGDSRTNTIMMGDHEEGLSFVENVAIDQHLFARNRQFDMFEILDNRPELLGIGLDEDTGIVVQGNTFEVIGNSLVAIYDGTRWSAERDTVYVLPEGSREFYVLRAGQKYDMLNREVIRN
ncbi:cyanophycinase [Balneola sp. MJW-20]|uniref:cyanophycinase n=1 Tax=Gracilimonas aurantiaca TaxID=3234185 RepID=UPI0034669874